MTAQHDDEFISAAEVEGAKRAVVGGETKRLSPKVPVQAVVTLVVAALAYFGVNLSPEVSAALGVLLGFLAGYRAPPGTVSET